MMFLFPEQDSKSAVFGGEFKTELDGFCTDIGAEVKVTDSNGDGYDDLTCHGSDGTITISRSHLVTENKPIINDF